MPVAVTSEQAVRLAARWLYRGDRLDMAALAAELGISRVTLFRRVGNREELMGEALWRLAELTLSAAVERWDQRAEVEAGSTSGVIRCLAVMETFRHAVADSPGLRRLLQQEPTQTIRVLTDPRGRVHPRLVEAYTELLRYDADRGNFQPIVELPTLAYALVRLGESFLYADVLAGRTQDLQVATVLVEALVVGRSASAGVGAMRSAPA